MKRKHSSGDDWKLTSNAPFQIKETHKWRKGVMNEYSTLIALAFGETKQKCIANAVVISAIPDMIKALDKLIEITNPTIMEDGSVGSYTTHVIHGHSLTEAIELALKAIEKATVQS